MRPLLIAVALVSWSVISIQAEAPQPQDAFMLEFVIGSIAAFGGGIGGVMAGVYLGLPAVESCERNQPSCSGDLFCFRFNPCALEVFP